MAELSSEYRAGWRAACAMLHDRYAEFAAAYADDPHRKLQAGIYERAATMAGWEAEAPQAGLVVIPAPEADHE